MLIDQQQLFLHVYMKSIYVENRHFDIEDGLITTPYVLYMYRNRMRNCIQKFIFWVWCNPTVYLSHSFNNNLLNEAISIKYIGSPPLFVNLYFRIRKASRKFGVLNNKKACFITFKGNRKSFVGKQIFLFSTFRKKKLRNPPKTLQIISYQRLNLVFMLKALSSHITNKLGSLVS